MFKPWEPGETSGSSGRTFAPAASAEDSAGTPFELTWPDLQPRRLGFTRTQRQTEEVEGLLRQTRDKVLLIEKEAYEKGFAQGERDGIGLGQKRLETTIHQFRNLLASLKEQERAYFECHEREMVQLALALLRKIVFNEGRWREDVIRKTLEEAMKHAADRRTTVIHLNPADHQSLRAAPGSDRLLSGEESGVKVVENPSIARGGCLLETAFGDVDATLESQFDQIASLVLSECDPGARERNP